MEDNQAVTQTEEKTEAVVVETTEENSTKEEVKTFTQDEVNAMIAKATKKMPSKEELQEFSNWKESKKTEAEKQAELTQKMTDTTNENVSLKQENQVLKAGVTADDIDYVVFKVSKMEGEFEDNLKEFLKENPKYLKTETSEVSKDTGTPVSKIKADKDDGVIAILKAKHPEAFKE